MLSAPLSPNFTRAAIDNDALPQVPSIISTIFMGKGKFRRAQKRLHATRVNVREKDGTVIADVAWSMPHVKRISTRYVFGGDGTLDVSMTVAPSCSMERYGFTWKLAKGIDGVTLYGKGPHENYCDRATGAMLGIWKGSAEEMIHDYHYPQENGNRTGIRYASVGSDRKITLRAVDKPFEMTVHPYTCEMLENAQHSYEPRQRGLSHRMRGRQTARRGRRYARHGLHQTAIRYPARQRVFSALYVEIRLTVALKKRRIRSAAFSYRRTFPISENGKKIPRTSPCAEIVL